MKHELSLKQTGEIFLLDKAVITIGRKACTITIHHPRVSRKHAYLVRDYDGNYVIFDGHNETKKASLNGTFVNNTRLNPNAINLDDDSVYCVKLKSFDLISIGGVFEFIYSATKPGHTTENGTHA